jgi:DNA-binding CsgD family transcriptional regulator
VGGLEYWTAAISAARSIRQERSIKKFAHEASVSGSTVRNTLARSCRKLGVNNMVGLITPFGRMELIE